MAKKSGKTIFSERRRTTKHKSGYKTFPGAVSRNFRTKDTQIFGNQVEIEFEFPKTNITNKEFFKEFGFYFRTDGQFKISSDSGNFNPLLNHTNYNFPNWNKAGNIWIGNDCDGSKIKILIESLENKNIELYSAKCGIFWHQTVEETRPKVIETFLRQYHAPLILFVPEKEREINNETKTYKSHTSEGKVNIKSNTEGNIIPNAISEKQCRTCGRYLPFNTDNNTARLAFTLHCSERKAPCEHSTFSRPVNIDTGEELILINGFQLECKFCKAYFVNGPLNPEREESQMKEDSQRRRSLENLLNHLNETSPQLSFRRRKKKEMIAYLRGKFNDKCFKCKEPLKKGWHLDHTRPLMLLWQIDETATPLCADCNRRKKAQWPSEFYSETELIDLAKLTGIPIEGLKSPSINIENVEKLLSRKDWFFDVFLDDDKLKEEKDGKIAAELICKSLDKCMKLYPKENNFSFVKEYYKRN